MIFILSCKKEVSLKMLKVDPSTLKLKIMFIQVLLLNVIYIIQIIYKIHPQCIHLHHRKIMLHLMSYDLTAKKCTL